MSDKWLGMRAAELGRGIAAGEIDPVALTEAFLTAAGGDVGETGSYARLTPERARAEAAEARGRARADTRRGPLDGVPVSWKDLFDSAGVATQAGSALLKGRVPEHDSPLLARATAAGLVCLGKTHMSELAFSGLGYNPVTGTPPCINDPEAVPGGSSSGAGTSVASGTAAIAVGSDTGGSVRIPSAWNDLVGFKPTHGALPMTGAVPLCARFDTAGPLARSVEDAALLYDVLAERPATAPQPIDLSGARIGVLETIAFDDIEDGPAAGFEAARAKLAQAGATLVPFRSDSAAAAMPLSGVLYTSEAYAIWGARIEAAPDLMFDRVRARFRAGRDHSAVEYIRAWRTLDGLRRDWLSETEGFDAVILPTCPIMPPNRARLIEDPDYFTTQNLLSLRNTRVGNLMGLCALSLPTGTPSTGLMVMAGPGQETALLRLGAAVEAALV